MSAVMPVFVNAIPKAKNSCVPTSTSTLRTKGTVQNAATSDARPRFDIERSPIALETLPTT